MLAQSCLKVQVEKGTRYELSMVCESKMRALEIRDYNTNKLKKYVTLPVCQNAYTYNVTAIPGSKVILYCYNLLGAPGGGGCIRDSYGTHCVIWRSWEGIELNFCNYEYRTIYGAWYYLYKLKSYSACVTTYGFYTTLPNKYYCKDSSVHVISNSDDHDFELDDYISYVGDEKWGVFTVFKSGVEYVTYDDGCNEGTKVKTYYTHDIDQDYEFYSTIPGGGVSLVDALNEIGTDSSYTAREAIAVANGIADYEGTPQQNTYLLNLLKKGKLKKP
jgi:hypothetical protein